MNEINKNLNYPIITGRPDPSPASGKGKGNTVPAAGSSFGELLQKSLNTRTQPPVRQVTFSKHAQARTVQRGVELSQADMDRLAGAIGTAENKGITDTLVMMNNTAFIVNVPNRVVVTVVDGNDDDSVFTNIDGAVIL